MSQLIPATMLYLPLERVLRDTAAAVDKTVQLEMIGGEIRLDEQLLIAVQGALEQLVRNAVVHGIEASGRVTISIARQGRRLQFGVSDDGRGIDVEAVRKAAGPAAAGLDIGSLLRRFVLGGITMARSAAGVSDHGVGLDVVRETAKKLGGEVSAESEPGKGSSFVLSLPLSLASVDILMVETAGIQVSLPLNCVRRALFLEEGKAVNYDSKPIPFVSLAQALKLHDPLGTHRRFSAVVVEGRGGLAAVGVDRICGTANVIVRPLPELAPADAVIAGASFDDEGDPQLLLDADALLHEVLH